jgi:AcrR family transcriptional regulator
MRKQDPAKLVSIYHAALQIVLREGFSALKMVDVAKEAGVATGTLYVYFEHKEHLINQLYLFLKEQIVAKFLVGYNPAAPFMACFEKIWFNYANAMLQQPETAAFLEQYYRSPFLKTSVKAETGKMLRPIFELLQRGKAERLLKDVPADLMAIQLNGAINELVRWHYNGQLKATQAILQKAFLLAWDSIKG